MIMPNFLIIGAQKAGTSALYNYLKQHPQIFMSVEKEPSFFHFEGENITFCGPGDQDWYSGRITNLEDYRRLFDKASGAVAVGEASTCYLQSLKAPKRIHHYIPDVRLIAILRNPVDRAYSAFMHLIRAGREPLRDFAQALQEEDKRIQNNWGELWQYKRQGLYADQLKLYFEQFDRNQIQVYLYEELENDPIKLLKNIFNFLNVDESFTPNAFIRYNASGIPKNKALHAFLYSKSPLKNFFKPLIPSELRERVINQLKLQNMVKQPLSKNLRHEILKEYRDDIFELQDLLKRDLSKWLK